jgi:hypothetical protein
VSPTARETTLAPVSAPAVARKAEPSTPPPSFSAAQTPKARKSAIATISM